MRKKQLEERAAALRYSVICALNQLVDLKDLNTGVHSTRLAEWPFIWCPFHGWLVSTTVRYQDQVKYLEQITRRDVLKPIMRDRSQSP